MVLGTVQAVQAYGAFVDMGTGTTGLLHVSQISHDRITQVDKVLSVGDKLKARAPASAQRARRSARRARQQGRAGGAWESLHGPPHALRMRRMCAGVQSWHELCMTASRYRPLILLKSLMLVMLVKGAMPVNSRSMKHLAEQGAADTNAPARAGHDPDARQGARPHQPVHEEAGAVAGRHAAQPRARVCQGGRDGGGLQVRA